MRHQTKVECDFGHIEESASSLSSSERDKLIEVAGEISCNANEFGNPDPQDVAKLLMIVSELVKKR